MPPDPLFRPRPPSWRTIDRFLALEQPFRLFAAQVAAFAARRPAWPVPAETLADARAMLIDARGILSREAVNKTLFELSAAPSWAGLSTRLALVGHALREFRENYYIAEDREWLAAEQVTRPRAELVRETKALEQKSAPF